VDDEDNEQGSLEMTQTFVYAVMSLDHALIWKGQLEPGSSPIRIVAGGDNPQYQKEHDSRKGDRDRSIVDFKFAEKVSLELKDASHIYLLSAGTGKSNTAHQLMDYLKEKHATIAARVIGTGSADVNALSDNQLLELGRDRKQLFTKTEL
jgi:hypothetical protein